MPICQTPIHAANQNMRGRSGEVVDWIAHHAATTPKKCAVVDLASGRRQSYVEMHDRVGRLARVMVAYGVRRGDRVAFLALNSTDILDIIFASWRIGAVSLALNHRLTAPELSYIINDATPKILFHDITLDKDTTELREKTEIAYWIALDGLGGDTPFEQAIAEAEPIHKMAPQFFGDQCLLMYSSGTTGKPKGVIVTHGMMFFSGVNGAAPSRQAPDTVCLAAMPIFHIGGLNVSCCPALRVGATVAVMRVFDPGNALDAINDPSLGVNHIFATPGAFSAMRAHEKNATTGFSNIVTAITGGETPPRSLIEWWLERGVAIQEGYAQTETAGSVTLLPREYVSKKTGSAGKPLMHVEIAIVDVLGHEVPAGTLGEIWIRGSTVTPGYWNDDIATAESFFDGWFRSGDLGRVDEDGFITIEDRINDMYISDDENIYPAEIENALNEMSGICEVAVIGVSDEKWGEAGCAVVVPHEDAEISEDDVKNYCIAKLARFKHPKHVVFADALPRNAVGKVLKFVLRNTVPAQLGENI